MHLVLVQPLYRSRHARECTRISIDDTIWRCSGRRYWKARAALCAFCTDKRFPFLISPFPYLQDYMPLALVQPLYRARHTRECTRISIDGTIGRCMGRRHCKDRTALCAFCSDKRFPYLNSPFPYLRGYMHLALVQPLYLARHARECTRISIYGTIERSSGQWYLKARTALCAFCTDKRFPFLNSPFP